MDPSFELPDSTDWLSTSLPAFEPLEAALRCEVCKEFYTNPVITSCAHTFCSICVRRCIATDGKCPACKTACMPDKLMPNIAVREVAARFVDARAKALELARKGDGERSEAGSLELGKKRKREEVELEGEGRRSTRSRQTRSSQRREERVIMMDDAPVVIPDIDDEKEYLPEGMAQCPICWKSMKAEAVYNHIPVCPATQEEEGGRTTRSKKNNAFLTAPQSRTKASGPPPTRLSGLHYPMLNEKALRKKLQELGIPSWGSKPLMIKRHQEWLNIYNSNCDASDDVRKSKRELIKELDDWERIQGGNASTRESQIMRKDFDGQNHAETHKSQFDDLIANARKRAKEAAKVKEVNAEETQSAGNNIEAVTTHPESGPIRPNIFITHDQHHPFDGHAARLAATREEVEKADRSDPAFTPPHQDPVDANMQATQNAQDRITLSRASNDSLGIPKKEAHMFQMPKERVVDVENPTAIK